MSNVQGPLQRFYLYDFLPIPYTAGALGSLSHRQFYRVNFTESLETKTERKIEYRFEVNLE